MVLMLDHKHELLGLLAIHRIPFQKREVNTIVGDIIKHMTPDRAYEDFYPQLQSVVSKVLVHIREFSQLFSMVGVFTLHFSVFQVHKYGSIFRVYS